MQYFIPQIIKLLHQDKSINPELFYQIQNLSSNHLEDYYISKSTLKRFYQTLGFNQLRIFKKELVRQNTIKYTLILDEFKHFKLDQSLNNFNLNKEIQKIKQAKRIIISGSDELTWACLRFACHMFVLKKAVYLKGTSKMEINENDYIIYLTNCNKTLDLDPQITYDYALILDQYTDNIDKQFYILTYFFDYLLYEYMGLI